MALRNAFENLSTEAKQDEMLAALAELGFNVDATTTAISSAATIAHQDALAIIAALADPPEGQHVTALVVNDASEPIAVTGPLTDEQLRATNVNANLFSGSGNALVASADNTDAITAGTGSKLATTSRTYVFNGSTWDRVRGDVTNGMDVDVTRVVPGTAADTLGKARDAAAGATDTGVAMYGVRNDSGGSLADTTGDYAPVQFDASGQVRTTIGYLAPGTTANALGKAEDAAHASGDTGVAVWAVRNDGAGSIFTSANGDYSPVSVDSQGRPLVRLHGYGGTELMKQEDSAHASGDTGVSMLAVRNDSGAALADTSGDYIPLSTDGNGNLRTGITGGVIPGVGSSDLGKRRDNTSTSTDVGVSMLAVRNDSATSLVDAAGDYAPLQVDATGGLRVSMAATVGIGYAAPGSTNLAKAEDTAHASGDHGIMSLGVRNTSGTSLSDNDGDYTPIATDQAGRVLMRQSTIGPAELLKAEDSAHASGDAGVALLGVRNSNSSTLTDAEFDYSPIATDGAGAVMIRMNPSPTQIAKQEDSAHASGDAGVHMLAVRNDTGSTLTDANFDYSPISVSSQGRVHVSDGGGSLTVDGPLTDAELRATPLPVSGPLTDAQLPKTETGAVLVGNARTKYRDEFATGTNQPDPANWYIEDEDPDTGQDGLGNLIAMGGDAYGARYVRLSLSPFIDDSRMVLTSRAKFKVPTRVMFGVHQSQRIVGTEMFFGLLEADDADPIGINRSSVPAPPDRAITANATVTSNNATFTVPGHGFTTGDRVIIYGCGDTRFNLGPVVISVSNADQIVTAITIANGTYTTTGGFVREADPLTRAHNGFGQLWENSTTSNASLVVRRNGQSYRSRNSGTGSSLSTAVSTSSWQDSLMPTAVNELMLTIDEAGYRSWSQDSGGGMSGMDKFTSTIPDEGVDYRIHFRARNLEGLSKPIAKIVSAVKSGSTTATITTDRPHGLTTGSRVGIYGIRDATNFANTSDIAVASVPSATTFTAAWGASATATDTNGGIVVLIHGSVIMPGAPGSLSIQSVSRDIYGQVTATMNTTATGWTVGDLVNLWGLNAAATAFEGVYKVVGLSTTELRLVPHYGITAGAAVSAITTGGAVIKRSEMRIQYVRVLDFTRHAVEVIGGRGHANDTNNAVAITSVGGNMNQSSLPPYTNETFETSTNLSANALYSGATRDVTSDATRVMSHLRILIRHLAGVVHGTLYVEQSTDASTWVETFRQPVPSDGLYHTFELALFSRYYRIRFQNGSVAQTGMWLHTRRLAMGGTVASEIDRVLTIPQSVTALAANATFTGPTLDLGGNHYWEDIRAAVYADVGGTLFIEESRDGTTWRSIDAGIAVAASGPQYLVVERRISQRYQRVRYVNGGTLQGAFTLDAVLSTN